MKNARLREFLARWYVPFVLIVWTFAPEARRLVDWQTGFHQFSPFSVLPLFVMLPGLFLLPARWGELGKGYRAAAALWMIGFGFAFLVAFVSGGLFSGAFSFAEFVMPMGIGVLLCTSFEPFETTYDRLGSTLLWCAGISSVYAIYQYVALPPWDSFWMQHANIESLGTAVPYGFRVFGPSNSTGPFAQLLLCAVLFNLPRLRANKIIPMFLLGAIFIAMTLTMVRLVWVALAIAWPVYIFLSPRRRGAIVSFVAIAMSFGLVAIVLLNTVPNANLAFNATVERLSTFQELETDSSVSARQQESGDAWIQGFRDPLGGGLGSSSGGSKLSGGNGAGLDNGYLNALIEMGVFGWIVFLLALTVGLWTSISAFAYARRLHSSEAGSIAAAAMTFQVMLLVVEAGFSNHLAYSGIFFWLSIFAAEASRTMAENDRADRVRVSSQRRFRGFAAQH